MLKRLLVGVSFLMLGAFGLQAQSDTQSGTEQQQMQSGSESQGSESQLSREDKDFLTKAYQTNLNEIELARLATQQASSSEVKQYAQRMIEEHGRSNEQIQQIASSKGVDLQSAAEGKDHSQFSGLSGSQFDQKYIENQQQAHQEAISMFRDAADKGTDPEIKSFASSQLSTLEQHQSMANDLNSKMGASQTAENQPSDQSSSTQTAENQPMDQSASSDQGSRADMGATQDQPGVTDQSRELPRTASNMPLIGLFGLLLIGAALVARSFRVLHSRR